jgi:hypothetical protein
MAVRRTADRVHPHPGHPGLCPPARRPIYDQAQRYPQLHALGRGVKLTGYTENHKHGGPSLWPWFDPKVSAQYVRHDRFDGATAGAADNNSLYLQPWLVV